MELQLWSRLGCSGILWHIRIPSYRLKVGGRPPKDLQLWSRLGCFGILRHINQDSQLSAQGRRTTYFGATTLLSTRLLWNPSVYQDSQLSAQGIGGRPPLELQLWSGLGCSRILRHIRIPSSQLKVGRRPPKNLQLWSRLGSFGILWHIRILSSWLKVGGRPPLELQFWPFTFGF